MDTSRDEKRVEEERMKQLEEGAPSGGWYPIKDIDKDPRIDVIAKFAISEFNKQNNSTLKFQTVVSGNMQIVEGINFRLVVEVSDEDDEGSKTYEAQVYEQAWLYSKVLTYFKSIDD